MRRAGWLMGTGLALATAASCTPPVNPAGDPLRAPTTGEAFDGVQCSAVRPPTEPDLMAWDPGSRANLSRLRQSGVVAVRYHTKGCNVELELLTNCIGSSASYKFSAYSANERKVAHNASELFAELPVGAARFSGKVKGDRALRTDYMLAGQYALPPESTFRRADLRGLDCRRATHVVSAIHVGAFAMAAGERRAVEGRATVFGVGGGGGSEAEVESLGDEGDAEACKTSQKVHAANDGCGVPLRVALLALDAEAAPECPAGSSPQGNKCVRKSVVTQVDCPAGSQWSGTACVARVDTTCARGLHFVAGRGCVSDAATPPPAAQPETPSASHEGMVKIPAGRFMMGTEEGFDSEKPMHPAGVSELWMDVTEVTVAAYEACALAGACSVSGLTRSAACNWGKAGRKTHPINCVDWEQAKAFCRWKGGRLPTEEEWEYAARGTDGRKYPWGNESASGRVCTKDTVSGLTGTCAVGSYPSGKSAFGLLDMAGNLWEMTSSQHRENYTAAPSPGQYTCRGSGLGTLVTNSVAATVRFGNYANTGGHDEIGFRCAQ